MLSLWITPSVALRLIPIYRSVTPGEAWFRSLWPIARSFPASRKAVSPKVFLRLWAPILPRPTARERILCSARTQRRPPRPERNSGSPGAGREVTREGQVRGVVGRRPAGLGGLPLPDLEGRADPAVGSRTSPASRARRSPTRKAVLSPRSRTARSRGPCFPPLMYWRIVAIAVRSAMGSTSLIVSLPPTPRRVAPRGGLPGGSRTGGRGSARGGVSFPSQRGHLPVGTVGASWFPFLRPQDNRGSAQLTGHPGGEIRIAADHRSPLAAVSEPAPALSARTPAPRSVPAGTCRWRRVTGRGQFSRRQILGTRQGERGRVPAVRRGRGALSAAPAPSGTAPQGRRPRKTAGRRRSPAPSRRRRAWP
jgi:hypothetical protein